MTVFGRRCRDLIAAVALFCLAGALTVSAADDATRGRYNALFGPLPADMATAERPMTPDRVALGRLLFFDTRLSKSQTIS